MVGIDAVPSFSPASLRCREALPSTVTASSLTCGWTSVLVERHRVEPSYEPFHTLATLDQTMVVMTRGEQALAAFLSGSWRQAAYRPGTIGTTPGGTIDRLRRVRRGTPAPFEKVNLYVPQQFFLDAVEHYRRAGHRWRDRPLARLAFQDPMIAEVVVALLRGMEAGTPNLYAETAMQWLATHLLFRPRRYRRRPSQAAERDDRQAACARGRVYARALCGADTTRTSCGRGRDQQIPLHSPVPGIDRQDPPRLPRTTEARGSKCPADDDGFERGSGCSPVWFCARQLLRDGIHQSRRRCTQSLPNT